MLSKEEKLRYGEILRQQMKEKQQRKKMEQMGKRQNLNVPKSQSDRILHADPTIYDPKIVLQQKLETQDYNPFGKSGGGAPNKKQINGQHNLSGVMLNSPQEKSFPKMQPQQLQYSDYPFAQPTIDPRYNVPHVQQGIRKEPTRQLVQNTYQASFENSGNQYPPKQNYPPQYIQKQTYSPPIPQKYVDPRVITQQQMQSYQAPHSFGQPQRNHMQYNPTQYSQYPPRQYQLIHQQPTYNDPYRPEYASNRQNLSQGPIDSPGVRAKTMQNEQLQQMYKKGGRNLLRLQNQTTNQHLVKQKQKQQMKNFLKQQMEEAQRKKQQQKQKIKRQQAQQQRKNKEYIAMQNQKLLQEQRKKNEQNQKLIQDNLKNLAKRKELEQQAKEKLQRQKIQQQRRHIEGQQAKKREKQKQEYIQVRQERPSRQYTPSSLTSSNSSEPSVTKNNFNTQISRQFFRKEKKKEAQRNQHDKKLEVFTNQIQKMRDQISNQGDMFKKEMDKIKREAQMAQDQKRRAELEIQRLRLQLQRKNKETQLRLLEALKRNDPYHQTQVQPPPYQQSAYHPPQKNLQPPQFQKEYDSLNQLRNEVELQDHIPYGIPSKPASYSAKPMSKSNKVYQQPNYQQKHNDSRQKFKWEENLKLEQSNVGTLDADSRKIPINLPQKGNKLTMSNIQNYGKESFMFGKAPPLPPPIQEQRNSSKQSRRNEHQKRDELDRFVQNNNKWEMSTVKDDITQQIQQLLKKKDAPTRIPPSQIQAAGRQVLSRGGLPYDGPGLNSLNSNKQSLVSNGTVDVDRIHDRNEARLRELKALGVQTINTTNDQDLNRLNALLNNYH